MQCCGSPELTARADAFIALNGRRPEQADLQADPAWWSIFTAKKAHERETAVRQPGGCSVYIVRRRRFCSHAAADGLGGLCSEHAAASAAVVSVGGERRVVLSDTLLADHTDEEVEVVVAHELAHVVHHDAVASQAALALHVSVSLLGADVALRWTGAEPVILPSRLLPLALLATGAAFLVLRPLMLAVSRHQERLADRYALTLTGNAPALQSVLRRMAANNLAEPAPSRGTVWWFHSHPAASERMPGSGHPTR